MAHAGPERGTALPCEPLLRRPERAAAGVLRGHARAAGTSLPPRAGPAVSGSCWSCSCRCVQFASHCVAPDQASAQCGGATSPGRRCTAWATGRPSWSRTCCPASALRSSTARRSAWWASSPLQVCAERRHAQQHPECRLLRRGLCAAYSRLSLDLDRIRADNDAKTDVRRKGGLIIWQGSACPAASSACVQAADGPTRCLARREPHDSHAQPVARCSQGQVSPRVLHLGRAAGQLLCVNELCCWSYRARSGRVLTGALMRRYELPRQQQAEARSRLEALMTEKQEQELQDQLTSEAVTHKPVIRACCSAWSWCTLAHLAGGPVHSHASLSVCAAVASPAGGAMSRSAVSVHHVALHGRLT